MGVPMINAIYEDTPLIGAYTLPLLVWHPMELVIGSLLAPRLCKWVNSEKERLRKLNGDDGDCEEEEPTEHMDVENQQEAQAEEHEDEEQSATLALQSMMSVTFYTSSTSNLEEASN